MNSRRGTDGCPGRRRESVWIYGHRGWRWLWPENTLESFETLARAGFTAVEIDVQNASGVPVVVHDPRVPMALARDSAGAFLLQPGPAIRDLTVPELKVYDVGRLNPVTEYASRYPDQQPIDGARIPTFAEFCAWSQGVPDMLLNVEIKSFADRDDLGDPPERLAEAVLAVASDAGLLERLILSSFDWRVLHAAARLEPGVARGYLTYLDRPNASMQANIIDGSPWMDGLDRAKTGGSLPRLIAEAGGQVWCPYHADLTEEDLAVAQEQGLVVNVWTVNDPDEARRLAAMGVDGIITDRPDRIRDALGDAARVCGRP